MAISTRTNSRILPDLAYGGELIGRDAELAMISAWLAEPSRCLLTITGEGGVGKTHLAVRAMLDASDHVQTAFISLAPVSGTGELMLSAIGHALGVDERIGVPLLDLIAGAFDDEPALLVLDNLEHLPEAPSAVATLLNALPGTNILATSRTPLHLRAEELLVLDPLPVPGAEEADSLERIAENASVRLFAQRVQRLDRSFQLTITNAGHVRDICRRLEGLPLAIELSAYRASVLSLPTMLERMDDQLDLLHARLPDAPSRQWSMQASIAWSLDLLDDRHQSALRRLAVFPGAFDVETAARIATASSDVLESLAHHHLIRKDRTTDQGDLFQLPEPIKQFGLSQLRERGEEAAIRNWHARVVAEIVEEQQARLNTEGRDQALAVLDSHLDDINAALQWTLAQRDLATAIRIGTGMQRAWGFVVHWSMGLRWLREIIATAESARFDDQHALLRLMLTTGLVSYHAEQYAESCQDFSRAVRLARIADDRNQLIDALVRSIPTMIELRQLDEAERLLHEALELIDDETPAKSAQMAATQRGILALHRGAFADALEAFQPGLDRARQFENPHSLAFHQRLVGQALYGLGLFEESREFYLTAREAQANERSTHYYITTLGLARLELAAGRPGQAAHWLVDYLNGRIARREAKRAREGLFEVARLAHLDGSAEWVAKLLGAACNGPTIYLPAEEQDAIKHGLTITARKLLGPAKFQALYRWGQSVALSRIVGDAITYATELEQRSVGRSHAASVVVTSSYQLTSREIQVLQCLAEGQSDREIGESLFISQATASTHVRNILRKLDAPSRSVAVVTAVRYGIVSLPR